MLWKLDYTKLNHNQSLGYETLETSVDNCVYNIRRNYIKNNKRFNSGVANLDKIIGTLVGSRPEHMNESRFLKFS